ncbi:MAG: LysM peptidoglycan-binding domain-containing protein, partial [Proteobacteria bacterium]|nr:LysM peptidoglycan-binding domain-containing protein [Pseudomonadota bacterium]
MARGRALLVLLSLLASSATSPWARAAEAPPAQGTRLRFEKTLSVQRTGAGKVFAETREVAPGETLRQILSREYGIGDEALPAFVRAFREVNPGVDPDRLAPG